MSKHSLKTPKYLTPYFDEKTQIHYYDEHKKHTSMIREIDERFICLKNLSSSTPMVNSATFDTFAMGGGLYFRSEGIGIVVDPGIGFVSMMHKYGIFIDDIDVVIVTHAHIDHNCDVSALSALLHDFNRNMSKHDEFYSKYLGCDKSKVHSIEWYLDKTTLNNTKDILPQEHVHAIDMYVNGDDNNIIFKNIELRSIRTKHIKNSEDTFGIKLVFNTEKEKAVWGYTSDTAFFEELKNFFSDCDGLILNISDIYKKDIEQKKFKQSHLGFSGCVELLDAVKPRIAIISEFCCTNGDYRHEIVRALRSYIRDEKIVIIPGDIGFSASIDVKAIECSLCKKDVSPECIKVIRPRCEFDRIEFVCNHCLL